MCYTSTMHTFLVIKLCLANPTGIKVLHTFIQLELLLVFLSASITSLLSTHMNKYVLVCLYTHMQLSMRLGSVTGHLTCFVWAMNSASFDSWNCNASLKACIHFNTTPLCIRAQMIVSCSQHVDSVCICKDSQCLQLFLLSLNLTSLPFCT